jgi:D-ribose pyranose/furanose isomerase RbsD
MIDNLKKFLNEEQDPKAIEKITNKLNDLLMRNEEVGYIGVQKKPVTVFPDSIVLTNKRIIICKPKNLGLSMDFLDYDWDDINATFVKENILGSEFSFSTKSDLTISIDYIPKTQARKISTYAKEQLDILKNGVPIIPLIEVVEEVVAEEPIPVFDEVVEEQIEETETEEVINFAEIVQNQTAIYEPIQETIEPIQTNSNSGLSQDELFAKLQNYKKLLDNGLIMQGEYDNFKKEILSQM